MNILQGFFSISALSNNVSGNAPAKFGELDTLTRTFTKDEKQFADAAYAAVELVTFQTLDELKNSVTPSKPFTNTILALGKWLYNQHINNNIPVESRKSEFITAIVTEIPSLTNVKIGEIQPNETGSRRFFDWISFELKDGTITYDCKIWASNLAMWQQYEGGSIVVFPPIDPVDQLNADKSTVVNLLDSIDVGDMMELIESVQGKNRATSVRTITLTHHDPNDPTATTVTNWYAVVWGNLINDLDNIKNSIRDYLSHNSTNTNWDVIYPELFASNEFVHIPLYENTAFSDSAIQDGGYRSITTVGNLNNLAKARIPTGYAQMSNINVFMASNLTILDHTYRTTLLLSLANPANKNDIHRITDLYPDYRALPTTNIDFNRMSLETQDWSIKMSAALELAYRFRESDVAPNGYYKIKRGLRTYLAFQIHGFYHLVLIKNNY